jgi:hypothetical protein
MVELMNQTRKCAKGWLTQRVQGIDFQNYYRGRVAARQPLFPNIWKVEKEARSVQRVGGRESVPKGPIHANPQPNQAERATFPFDGCSLLLRPKGNVP